MSFFGKLFGKRPGGGDHAAQYGAGTAPSGEEAVSAERPLFRDEVAAQGGGQPGGRPPASVDQAAAGRIGFGERSTTPTTEGDGLPVCPRCGAHAAEASRFCSQCGTPLRAGAVSGEHSSETTSTISISGLEAYDSETTGQTPLLSPEAQAAVEALPPGSALLVVRRGPNSGARFLLDAEVTTAGRHPQSDIFLDDVTVSRRHVEFRRESDGRFTVVDVGSLNGTYVNRERIDAVPLASGDEVQIGKFRLVFLASQHGV